MFCPKCGEQLSETPAGLVCQTGNMEITKELENRLLECYVLKLRQPREMPFNFSVGGHWFCPQCGISALDENGTVRCPECNLSLNEFIHSLIERHPHFDGVDQYY
jgi:uncharacterized Zn finger protein (UPF0148 family)